MPETIEGAGADAQGSNNGDGLLSNDEHESNEQLTPRAQRSVGEYLIDLNATAAYRRAYPDATEKSASTLVARLLLKVGVSEAIAAAQAERARRTEVNADKALADVWAKTASASAPWAKCKPAVAAPAQSKVSQAWRNHQNPSLRNHHHSWKTKLAKPSTPALVRLANGLPGNAHQSTGIFCLMI